VFQTEFSDRFVVQFRLEQFSTGPVRIDDDIIGVDDERVS